MSVFIVTEQTDVLLFFFSVKIKEGRSCTKGRKLRRRAAEESCFADG